LFEKQKLITQLTKTLSVALRYTVITECLTLNVLNSLQDGACQTVRGIALRKSIPVATTHKIFTYIIYDKWVHIYMKYVFSVAWCLH